MENRSVRRASRVLFVALALFAASGGSHAADFVRGDVNDDGSFDIGDAVAGLGHLFGSQPIGCEDALDSNDDGLKDIADPVHILAALFSSGPLPSAPFPDCGGDPTADALTCATYAHCACPPDPFEPNESAAVCGNLLDIEDDVPFPAGTVTLSFGSSADEDWFCYHIEDVTFGSMQPRVEVIGIPAGMIVELRVDWTCDSGGSGTESATNGALASSVFVEPMFDCTGPFDDSMQIEFRVRQVGGPSTCDSVIVGWGDS